MKNVVRQRGYWLGGIAVAATGIVMARWAPSHAAPGLRLPLTVIGQLLAVAGLVLISVGVSRRVRGDASGGGPGTVRPTAEGKSNHDRE